MPTATVSFSNEFQSQTCLILKDASFSPFKVEFHSVLNLCLNFKTRISSFLLLELVLNCFKYGG